VETLKKYLRKRDIVFCGALEYKSKQTSDSTAADLAFKLGSDFINLSNVKGLYDKNPSKFKNAKFISEISWGDFDLMAQKLGFKPGQHFVLDQTASKIIKKHKIVTYLLGQNMNQLDNLLKGKKYIGSVIRN
jgi:uridylate kinase